MKNPYACLYGLLLLAKVSRLTSNVAKHGGMACFFTTLTRMNVEGTFARAMDAQVTTPRQADFRTWAAIYGLTPEIVREVEEAGDTFEEDQNDPETCGRRYEYMREWLDERARAFAAAPGPAKRPVRVYTFKVVRLSPLSDAELDELAHAFEEGAPVRVRVIPEAEGRVEDAGALDLEDWYDGET